MNKAISLIKKSYFSFKELFLSDKQFCYLLSFWLGIMFTLSVFYFANKTQLTVATVDITGIVNQFVQSQVKLNLPAKELQKRVNNFGNQLQETLDNVAQKRHVVLMVKEAVVAGGQDLTPVVKQKLSKYQY